MNEPLLASELVAARRRSLQCLPVAAVMFVALAAVVYVEGLHRSDSGFLAGVLVGTLGYWTALEAMTVARVGRLLRQAATALPRPAEG